MLIDREKNQSLVDSGILPGFDPNTKEIRDSVWKVRDVPHDLLDRRLEITGPVDRKMIINALNSNVNVFMELPLCGFRFIPQSHCCRRSLQIRPQNGTLSS